MLKTDVAWSQIIGARAQQQDHVSVVSWPNGFKLLLLADGMGGHASGDVASKIVVEGFKTHFIASAEQDIQQRLMQALEAVNILIYKAVKEDLELSGMGTTLIAAVFDGRELQWLSVGDSPMWLFRDGQAVQRLNENHSMSEVLARRVKEGEISQEQADSSPQRSQLLEAVMGEDIRLIDAPKTSTRIEVGDYLVLASDGVETLDTEEIKKLLTTDTEGADSLCLKVLNAVDERSVPKQDNASIIIMRCSSAADVDAEDEYLAQDKAIEEPKTV